MQSVVRVWSGVAVSLVLSLVPAALAQSAKLREAADLFERQEYQAAQQALQEVRREELSEAELARLDELLRLVPEAIRAAEKAAQDLAAAGQAYDRGEWDAAERLYQAVVDNRYARPAQRQTAAEQQARIAEKRRLAEAAKPGGLVEEPPVEPPPAAKAAEPPAPAPTEGPRRLTPADEMRMRDDLLWQRAVARALAAADAAREAMSGNRYDEARKLVDTAQQVIEAARRYAEPIAKYEAMKSQILQLREELDTRAREYEQQSTQQQLEQIRARQAARREILERQKAETIEQLFNNADQLRRERKFGEAAETLRQILRIAPDNARARYELSWAEDLESYSQQADWYRDVQTQQRQTLIETDEALIPWSQEVLYPRNWLEITAKRSPLGVATRAGTAEDNELNRKLSETLPEVRFEQQPFEQVVEFLAEITKINIAVDWTDLSDHGIEKDKQVTLRLTNLTFRTVLQELISQVGGDVELAYAVGDGLLRIATKAKLDKDKFVLIYDIRDLLITPQRAMRPQFDVTQGMGQTTTGGGGGGGLFGQGQQQQQQEDPNAPGASGALVEQIIDIIRQTVEPDSWRETGGGDASIRELNGQLIIYNTSSAHRQVADLLSQLREQRALQIAVEARFLNVVSNFLEQFGVDLDFVFNSGSAGYDRAFTPQGDLIIDPATGAPVLIDRRYSRAGVFPSPPPFGTPLTPGQNPVQPYNQAGFVPRGTGVVPQFDDMTPIGAQQGSLNLVNPASINTGVPGSFAESASLNPALNITGSFLDNLQVDFLIRATQANGRSSVLQAPRLVLFNGQAAVIAVGRTRQYISTLRARIAEGAVGFEPQTANADSLVSLFVEGTISADRRYVTLNLSVDYRDDPILTQFETQRGSGNSPSGFIQLVNQAFITVRTTASVPDGGTVLLGGLKQVGDVEIEAGVPVLSKIPVLKRAFSNVTTVKDTRTLLILVKAKIIIQKEAEEEAFPTFTRAGL